MRRLRVPGPLRSRARAEADRLRNGSRPCGCAYDPVVFGHTGCELAGGAQWEWPGPELAQAREYLEVSPSDGLDYDQLTAWSGQADGS